MLKTIDISTFNNQQREAWGMILTWINEMYSKEFVLSGFSGSGKSYLISKLQEYLINLDVDYKIMSFTGKAVDVLRGRGLDNLSTIHSAIYKPILDENDEIVDWELNYDLFAELIIIDEYSMLTKDTLADLRSFGYKILFVGDHFQLPPVSDDENGLKELSNYTLTEVVRQALGNPIIKLATKLRNGETLSYYEEVNSVGSVKVIPKNSGMKVLNEAIMSNEQCLCGTNNLKDYINKKIRINKGITSEFPVAGEKLICLKNNKKVDYQVFNGQMLNVSSCSKKKKFKGEQVVNVKFSDNTEQVVSADKFIDPKSQIKFGGKNDKITYFDYAYGITVHKSQGSQFESVVLFAYDGKWMGDKFNRWMYTGLIRAERDCVIVF